MHINEVLSYGAGWSLLTEQRTSAWSDLQSAVDQIDERRLLSMGQSTYRIQEGTSVNTIASITFQRLWDQLLQSMGWEDHRIQSKARGGLNLVIRNSKDHVSARLISSDRITPTFVNWLLVEAPQMDTRGLCDLAVAILPMESVQALITDRRRAHDLFTFDRARAQFTDLLPLRHSTPVVILGISSDPAFFGVEEFIVELPTTGGPNLIEKSIVFPPEYYQAGVSILSYFGEVLKQKHPDIRAKVRIEQDGLTVRLYIESASGDQEIIERTLEQYGLVVADELPPSSFFEGSLQVMGLKHKLEMVQFELRHTRELLAVSEGTYAQVIKDLHDEIGHLRRYVGYQLSQVDAAHSLVAQQTELSGRLLTAHVEHSTILVQDLIKQVVDNQRIVDALMLIDQKLSSGIGPGDEERLNEALSVIYGEKPEVLGPLRSALSNLSYGVAGNYIFQLLQAFLATL